MSQTHENFGKYILLEKLAMGGMAEIYLARNSGASGVSKFVAIKRILPQFTEQTEFIEMFKDEAKIAVNLTHANIVSIYEFGIEKNAFFLVMDYIEGKNLRQILNKMKKSNVNFTIEQILYIIKEVAAGLDHAHRCIDANTGKPLNIIHRDMSPQNVMVSYEGEVKIVDFGIAKAETQIESTRAGTLKGKFGYMSPEQAEGQPVDLRTDVFALGIVLWELLANDRLFVANNEINTLRKIRDCQIPSLRKINPAIAPELERIVGKALAKDRNLRYQTAAAFHRELSRFLNRQYPDFSAQDFSVFVKTLFSQEILESRKKMVEYAKIEFKQESVSSANLALDRTAILTQTNSLFDASPEGFGNINHPPQSNQSSTSPGAFAAQSSAGNANSVLTPLSNTPRPQEPMRPRPSDRFQNGVSGNAPPPPRDYSSSTYAGTRSITNNTKTSSVGSAVSLMSLLLIIGCMIGGGAYYFSNPQRAVSQATHALRDWGVYSPAVLAPMIRQDQTSVDPARSAVEKYEISVKSSPSGAPIEVDGKPTGEVTPANISIEKGRTVVISISLTGYFKFQQSVSANSAQTINAELKADKKGFLNIIVRGEAQIFVNDKYLTNVSPAKGILVAAGEPTKILAYNPQTKASDQVTVTVDDGATKNVTLSPHLVDTTK